MRYLVDGIAIGIGATLLMDLWNLFLKRVFGVPSLNYCFLGRWVLHIPDGTFRHPSIAKAAPKSFECQLGWITHYTIGISLAIVFVAIVSGWVARPTLMPAIVYGIATVVFPFFVLQPSLGLGIASAKSANPTKARIKSLATHFVFGAGMYLTALVVSRTS
jgi:Protein of unknown function (DUF2938)